MNNESLAKPLTIFFLSYLFYRIGHLIGTHRGYRRGQKRGFIEGKQH